MSKLFEGWRKFLITEAAATVDDLIRFNKKSVTGPNRFNAPDDLVDWAEDMVRSYGPIKVGAMYNFEYTYEEPMSGIKTTLLPNTDAVQRIIGTPVYAAYKKALIAHVQKMPVPKSIIYIDHNPRGSFIVGYGAVVFIPKGRGKAIDVQVMKFQSSKRKGPMEKGIPIVNFPAGSIKSVTPYGDKCSDGYVSKLTYRTKEGWGPLLYSISMEHASEVGGGLMSDRGLVSGAAKGVWDYFDKNKKGVGGPVVPNQMDISDIEARTYGLNQLTPDDESDDCSQVSSIKYSLGNDYGDWTSGAAKDMPTPPSEEEKDKMFQWAKQSLSKTFTKTSLNIKKLIDANLLHSEHYGKNLEQIYQKQIDQRLANLKVGDELRYRDIKEGKKTIKVLIKGDQDV